MHLTRFGYSCYWEIKAFQRCKRRRAPGPPKSLSSGRGDRRAHQRKPRRVRLPFCNVKLTGVPFGDQPAEPSWLPEAMKKYHVYNYPATKPVDLYRLIVGFDSFCLLAAKSLEIISEALA